MRLLLPALCLTAAPALAQPTVTSASLPQTGTVFTGTYVAGTAAVPPGPAGPNVTWDFTTVTPGSTFTVTYAACPGAAGCSTFPGATLAADAGGSASYYSISPTAQAIRGISAGGTPIVYSDPEDYVRVPMVYNGTFTDPFAAQFTNGSTFYRRGTGTNLVDGWGTLKTPGGVFNNCLRVKRTMVYSDSLAGFGNAFSYQSTTYMWYSPAIRDYLMVISALTVNGSSTTNSAGYRTGVTAVEDPAASQDFFTVSPNPAADRLAVRWNGADDAQLTLTDLTGRTLLRAAGHSGSTLAVDALPRGLYILRVRDESGAVYSQKVTLR